MSTREEIENALNRFMNSFDLKDWATMASVLEPTIRVDYSDLRGGPLEEISAAEYVNARVDALQHLSTQHLLSNIVWRMSLTVLRR
jgi:SnoaL-like domain